MSPYRAKKRLGQNFLVDQAAASRIVKALNIQPGDNVIEIGPGKGALTEYLTHEECQITAIEFDRDLIPLLRAKFSGKRNINIMAADILKITVNDLPDKFKTIGNLPYNISTVILEKMIEFESALETAVFTVQSEVANRLTAGPGGRDYGSLTVIMTARFDIESLFDIPPASFRPSPAVNSSVIRILPVNRFPGDFVDFRSFIHGCFRQKRKTLSNSMQMGLNIPKYNCEALIKEAGWETSIRPEQLSFDDFKRFYNLWRGTQQ